MPPCLFFLWFRGFRGFRGLGVLGFEGFRGLRVKGLGLRVEGLVNLGFSKLRASILRVRFAGMLYYVYVKCP